MLFFSRYAATYSTGSAGLRNAATAVNGRCTRQSNGWPSTPPRVARLGCTRLLGAVGRQAAQNNRVRVPLLDEGRQSLQQ